VRSMPNWRAIAAGPRRRARGGDVHGDRHRQAQRCRSAGLARRCPRPDRGHAADPAPRTPPLELGPRAEARSGRVGQIARGPLRSEPAAAQNQIEHPRGLRRMLTVEPRAKRFISSAGPAGPRRCATGCSPT